MDVASEMRLLTTELTSDARIVLSEPDNESEDLFVIVDDFIIVEKSELETRALARSVVVTR